MNGRSDCAKGFAGQKVFSRSQGRCDSRLRFPFPKSNNSTQLLPCSLLITSPSQRQEIDCKMQPNSRYALLRAP
jgi:hypothetical protein